MFYCNYLTSRLNFFNHELEETFKYSEVQPEKLQNLKALDMKLIKISILIRDYFKVMLLLTTTVDLIVLVISIYWIYGGFIFGNNPFFARKFAFKKS